MATAGSIVIDLLLRTGSFSTNTKRAEKRLKGLEKTAYNAGKLIGVGISSGAAAITALTAKAINFADQMDEMSQRLGISTETLSGLSYAAKLSGTSFESLTNAIPKLSKNLAAAMDDSSRMGQLFKTLGVSVKDSAGNLRAVEDVLPDIADRFKALDNDTTEAALALELFGKSGAELLEFLNRGSGGIKTLTDRAAELGIVVSSETAGAAAEFKDKLDDLKAVVLSFGIQIAERLLPALSDTVDELIKISKEGSLAANAVEVISAAFSAGVGVIGLYNRAVASLSIEIERVAKSASGLGMAVSSLSIGGLLSGANPLDRLRVAKAGFDQMLAADEEARKQWTLLNKQVAKPGVMVRFSDSGNAPDSMFKMSAGELAARKQAAAIEELLNKFLAGGGNSAKAGKASKAPSASDWMEEDRRKLQEMVEAEAAAREAFEAMAAQLAGPVADANYRYSVDLERLNDLARQGAIANDELTTAQENLRKEHEANLQAIERQLNPGQQLLKNLQFELELMKMGNVERQTAIALRGLETDQIKKYSEEIAEANRKLEEQYKKTDLMDDFRDTFKDFFKDVLSGTESISNSFKDMLSRIDAMILDRIAQNWVDQLFGQKGSSEGGTFGNVLGTIAGWFGGARAGGGDVFGDRAYLVGEQGPEMFVPRTAGAVLPAAQTAAIMSGGRGGRSVTVNQQINVQGLLSRRSPSQIATETAKEQRRALLRN